jgi:predicted MFS family arabinose efflux permease
LTQVPSQDQSKDPTAANPTEDSPIQARVPQSGTAGLNPPRAKRGGLKTFTALQNNRDYRFLWAGNVAANGAQWLQIFTIGWLVFSISGGSALHSVAVAGIRSLPILVIGPWAGVLADRLDRRKLLIATQFSLAVLAAAFALVVASGRVEVWHAYTYMSLAGIGFAIKQPLRQALVANTVQRSDLANAMALNAMGITSMRLAGPLLGGILIGAAGFKWNFFFEAGLYVVMVLLLLPMRTPYRQTSSSSRSSNLVASLLEGLRYIFGNAVMRRLTIVNFVRTGVFMPLILLLPVYTQQALGAGVGTGSIMIAVMGIGGFTATFVMATWGFFAKKGAVVLITLLTGSIAILMLGISHWLWLSLAMMLIMGLSQTHFIVSNQTLIQTMVPDDLRGRVSSVWHYESGLIPLAAVAIGVVADRVDINTALTGVGIIALALGISFAVRFKDIWSLD